MPGISNPASNSTNTADIATFNTTPTTGNGTTNPLINDSGRMIGGMVFDTANAGAFNIGAVSGAPTLELGNNLAITETATVVNPETINAPLGLHLPSSTNGGFTIQNNSSTGTAIMTLAGGLVNSVNSTRGTAWTLGGANTGNNIISGTITISNSGGIASTITKTGAGFGFSPVGTQSEAG